MAGNSLGDRIKKEVLGESLLVPHHTGFWLGGWGAGGEAVSVTAQVLCA